MITKRLLGLGFAATGLISTIGLLALDFVRQSDFQGIGPMQRLALIASIIVLIVGLTLIPFGDSPA